MLLKKEEIAFKRFTNEASRYDQLSIKMNENADIEAIVCGSWHAPTPTSAICYWLRLRARVAAFLVKHMEQGESEEYGVQNTNQLPTKLLSPKMSNQNPRIELLFICNGPRNRGTKLKELVKNFDV